MAIVMKDKSLCHQGATTRTVPQSHLAIGMGRTKTPKVQEHSLPHCPECSTISGLANARFDAHAVE
jgi:hypothetical protein